MVTQHMLCLSCLVSKETQCTNISSAAPWVSLVFAWFNGFYCLFQILPLICLQTLPLICLIFLLQPLWFSFNWSVALLWHWQPSTVQTCLQNQAQPKIGENGRNGYLENTG